jgi:hypothetical protein
VEHRTVTPCAEFPNDNPALHAGAIWLCLDLTGAAVCERPLEPELPAALEAEVEADDDVDDIEIVDELPVIEGLVMLDESPEPAPASDDPFVALGDVLEAVARGAGASQDAAHVLRVVLGRERVSSETGDELLVLREQAAAWQAILRGESEDFAACGVSSLDEWSSIAIARAMGEMGRADGLRRELRRRGVAAFGLVIEAA